MLRLRIVQAEYGDCLILEFGTASKPRYILIDGGPETIYDLHLRGELEHIKSTGGKLDLAMLSHVDNDHVVGLLDLVTELRQQRANGTAETIAIDALWLNSFKQTIGSGNDIEARVSALMTAAGSSARMMGATDMAVKGISEGHQLRLAAATLKIPLNPGIAQGLVCVDDMPKAVPFGNLRLQVVGPTKQNLQELREDWLAWLQKHEDAVASGDPRVAAMADRSIPNLSSIMVLARAHGKKILLTGDGRGDHLLQGLEQAKLLDANGKLHVHVLKAAHHGSDRNVTKKFFERITADTYVLSANGTNGNPDLATLIWIVESARKRHKKVELVATNRTPSTDKLLEEYDPAKYYYHLTVMESGKHAMSLDLA